MSHRDKTVTAVVVNLNRRELLRACLRSLANQTGVALDVILVDNGSTDGSAEMADREFAGLFPLRIIRNKENLGFCAANNQGISAATSGLIALLNNDAEAEPGWLSAMASALERHPAAGMAACKIVVWEDPQRIDKVGHLMYPDGQNRGRGTGQRDVGQFDREEEVLWPDGCAAMYRKSMLDRIGGFDEDFFAYADDAELGLRARIAGWGCIYTPEAVVRHHRGATLGVRSPKRLELIERNRILLVAKLFPMGLLCLNLPYFAARVMAGASAALRGHGEAARFAGTSGKLTVAKAMLKGGLAALPLLPRMFAKRRDVNRIRKLSPREVTQLLLAHRIGLSEISRAAN